jgi:MoxR-like ATPase/uncharacterized protein (DUF2461 family)
MLGGEDAVSEATGDTDPTPAVLDRVRSRFGDRFVASRVEAEQAAAELLNQRAGDLGPAEAMRLGQLFNTHELGGQTRLDRFLPGFAGASMQKVTQDLERFNEVVADLWTAPEDTALESLGRIYADRSVLPGAGSSLPSMLLYLRDPDRFGVCLNATMRGLAEALGCPPFKADSRANYERFCEALREWRERYDVAPQEVDAVLTAVWRDTRAKRQAPVTEVFGDGPMHFLADLAANSNRAWMQANQDRYKQELRQPFVALLEQIAAQHLRELDPQLDTAVKANRVLALIRKRFPDASGEYYEYLWGAFSRGRKQEDVQLAVLVQPEGLEVSLYLGSAQPEQLQRLRDAIESHGEGLIVPLAPYRDTVVWELDGSRENPLEGAQRSLMVTDPTDAIRWLDEGGTSIKWFIPRHDQLLSSRQLPDRIGQLFRALHPLAAAAWGDDVDIPDDPSTVEDDTTSQATIEEVAERCYLPPEILEEWVHALTGTMRQGLFYGPPGTGKTFLATQLAGHLATSPEHIELVQFHPAYSYEDFIEGLRPTTAADTGMLEYTVRPGLFQQFCNKARAAGNDTFVLLIDEMNRADVAAVFGEMLLLLEYRGDRSVVLPYSQRRFTIPRNVIVLGTMNTADRSLALVDFALRRRFNAFPLNPSHDVLAGWAKAHPDVDADLILTLFGLIQDRIGKDNSVAPGHSYWMVDDADPSTVERIWAYQVRPYLAEHWFERPEELATLDRDVQALIAEQS